MTTAYDSDQDTSGFTQALEGEMQINAPTDNGYTDLSPLYVSNSGPAMLYTARRYGRRYTVKCLRADYRHNPLYLMALRKEFELGITLDHPNVRATIAFEDFGTLGPGIVMEYIDGITLQQLMDSRGVNSTSLRPIIAQIASALQYIHSKQVIHRDIKPANIMLTHSGNVVKVIDFSLSDSDTFLALKFPAGTRSYMAPEQQQPGAKADVRADIFSFGLIVAQLAQPLDDALLMQVAAKASAKNPADRPQSMAELNLPTLQSHARPAGLRLTMDSPLLTRLLAAVIMLTALAAAALWYRATDANGGKLPESADNTLIVSDPRTWPKE